MPQPGADWRSLRAAQLEKLKLMPEAMRALPQWLVWKLEEVPGRNGLHKVPYYADGGRRALNYTV